MKKIEQIMGMPITVIVPRASAGDPVFKAIFGRLRKIDEQFSPYKESSEVSAMNRGLSNEKVSPVMRDIIERAEDTKAATGGFFDVWHGGHFDPSGIVKGWAIDEAARVARDDGCIDYYIEAGGDISLSGRSDDGNPWHVGIRNPFNRDEIVEVLELSDCGVATSGTAIRGQHIYNPHDDKPIHDILSLTVIGPTIYDADRFATAAFAMGQKGIDFIESLDGYEGYMIDHKGIATMTSGFDRYKA